MAAEYGEVIEVAEMAEMAETTELAGGWTAGREVLQSVACGFCQQTGGAVLRQDGRGWLCCFCQPEAWHWQVI